MCELIMTTARVHLGDKRIVAFTLPAHLLDVAIMLFRDGMKKSDDCYEVRVRLPKRHRSTGPGSASAHFHGHCGQLAGHFGYSMDEMKQVLKYEAIPMGYPSKVISGHVILGPESDASPEEESYLIETCHRIAAENGVILKEE